MNVLIGVAAAVVLAALLIYRVTHRSVSRATNAYIWAGAVLSLVALGTAVLREWQAAQAAPLLEATLLALVMLVPVGLIIMRGIERRERRHVELFRTAATMLMPTGETGELLEQVLDLVHAAVKVDGSSIMLLDDETRTLRFAAVRGGDPTRARNYEISIDHPAIASVWSGEGPLIVEDLSKAPEFRRILGRLQVSSFFSIPMVTRGTLIGFLNVHRTRVSKLEPEEIDLLTALASQAGVAIVQSRLYKGLHQRYLETIGALASAMEINDPFTMGHSRRVATLSRLLAAEIGMPPSLCDSVEVAALLHDIGKIGISNSTLRKLGQLSPEERTEVRAHSMLGATVLRDVETLREALPVVLYHHERWDGRGYPDGIAGTRIPDLARVVSVADAYEVMTAGRSYRAARPPESAMAEMKREAGRQFDPAVVDALVRLYDRGALRELQTETPHGREQSHPAAS